VRRQQFLVVIVLLVLVGLSSWWSWRLDEASRHAVARPGEPDYIVTSFVRTRTDPEGQPSERLASPLLIHYTDGGGAELVRPEVRLYTAGGLPWEVLAERAWVDEAQDVVLLYGEVEGWRNNPEGIRESEFQTRDLRILRQARYAETDASGVLRKGSASTFGVGLEIDLASNRLTLLGAVRTRYEPEGPSAVNPEP
jgi:lipopolysaccharide export system protein LptC